MEADWNRKMSLIHTRCRREKSLKTHLMTETALYRPRAQHPPVAEGEEST